MPEPAALAAKLQDLLNSDQLLTSAKGQAYTSATAFLNEWARTQAKAWSESHDLQLLVEIDVTTGHALCEAISTTDEKLIVKIQEYLNNAWYEETNGQEHVFPATPSLSRGKVLPIRFQPVLRMVRS